MTTQRTTPSIAHAELRMLQGIAATIVMDAANNIGVSRCRFGRFELTAQRFGNTEVQDKVTMELMVTYAGEIIEYDRGHIPRRSI
ncbi:MAG: hypothetical protein V4568_01700 [Pseudomonadota bacterium]